jgi:DNA gyrase/topoisomerase IV subunit A
MAAKYDVEAMFNNAVKLITGEPNIIFESTVAGLLGVSREWFYSELMASTDRADTIKALLQINRSKDAITAMNQIKNNTDTTELITRLKLTIPEAKEILTYTYQKTDVKADDKTVEDIEELKAEIETLNKKLNI